MSRNWATTSGTMGNNSLTNKDFDRAAREAGLTENQKREFSKQLHEDKEYECGDRTYSELLALAYEVKSYTKP